MIVIRLLLAVLLLAAMLPASVSAARVYDESAGPVPIGPGKWYDDGPGLYGAMGFWHWGMAVVPAEVCGDRGCVELVIRDHMVSRTTLIDLSPAAFRVVCGPLTRGRCTVTVSR